MFEFWLGSGISPAETTLGVEDLLPNGQISLIDTTEAGAGARLLAVGSAAVESPDVSCELPGSAGEVVSGEGSITVSAEPICVAWTLAELCPECRVGQPIPRIDTNKQQTWELPPEVVSVQISSGRVVLSLDHDLDFAPLRAGELGGVAISIGTGDAPEQELLRWVLDQDLEPGKTVSHTLDFSQNPVTVSGGLRLQITITTAPDGSGQPVTDLAQVIRARAQVQSLTIDSAVVTWISGENRGSSTWANRARSKNSSSACSAAACRSSWDRRTCRAPSRASRAARSSRRDSPSAINNRVPPWPVPRIPLRGEHHLRGC